METAVPSDWAATGPRGYHYFSPLVRRYRATDTPTFRKALDDNIMELLVAEFGLVPDRKFENLRMLISFLSIAVCVAAYCAPVPFPGNTVYLLGSVVFYYLCGGAAVLIGRLMERSAFCIGHFPKAPAKTLYVASGVKPCSPGYQVALTLKAPGAPALEATREFNVGQFFSKEGLVYPPALREAVASLLSEVKAL